MESPQSEIQKTEASPASMPRRSEAGLLSLQDEVHTLRSTQSSAENLPTRSASGASQLTSLEIVDEHKRKDAARSGEVKAETLQEVQAQSSPQELTAPEEEQVKDATDLIITENSPGTNSFNNPYSHVSLAGEAMREISALSVQQDNEVLIVINDKGEKEETTVKDRIKFLTLAAKNEFEAAISAADSINQTEVEATLFDVRAKIGTAKSDEEKSVLLESETALESLKHAPSATRFALAMFIAGNGQLEEAVELLKEAEKKDPDAAIDSNFLQFKKDLEDAIGQGRKEIINREEFMLPLITMSLGDAERQSGNMEKAEEHYADAIKQADELNQMDVQEQLETIQHEMAELGADLRLTDDPDAFNEALKELEDKEMAWATVAHASALTRINYADFLISQGRGAEAHQLLLRVQEIDPELVRGKKEFDEMLALSDKVQTAADLNPFQHLENFTKALEEIDIDKARAELHAAVNAADNLDRDLARKNKEVVAEQLKVEQDPQIREGLTKAYEIYDAFEHAASFTRIVLGRFELAAKNYNQARELFAEAKELDPNFVERPEIEYATLLEAANEPSTFTKILEFTTDLAEELLADAAAAAAGAAAVFLTGWSGPGAVVAGATAGAGTYTTVKWLMGDDIYWYTPLWGAIDGATGSIAALARRALIVEGGKLISKEVAEAAVIKTGGEIASLSSLEGLKLAEAAQKVAATGLKSMGKDIGLWSRISSSIPFIGTGSAEYRAALAAYRSVAYTNFAIQSGVNAGTAMAASTVYRGTHEAVNYYNGVHESFGAFARAYGEAVFKDTLTGVVMGGYANAWKDGLALSTIVNGISAGLSEPTSVVDFMNTFAQKTSTDLAFGSYAWLLGFSGFYANRYIHQGILPGTQGVLTTSVPLWSEAFYTNERIRDVIAPALVALQTPPTAEELPAVYQNTAGPDQVPEPMWIGA